MDYNFIWIVLILLSMVRELHKDNKTLLPVEHLPFLLVSLLLQFSALAAEVAVVVPKTPTRQVVVAAVELWLMSITYLSLREKV